MKFGAGNAAADHETFVKIKDGNGHSLESCSHWRPFSSQKICLRAIIPPDQVLFNHEIAMELLWVEPRPVLHLVSIHTSFQSATVLRSNNGKEIWYALLAFWCTL